MATLLLTFSLFAAPQHALAYDPFGTVCSNGGGGSTVCNTQQQQASKSNSDPLTGSHGILADITNIVAFAGGAAAVIMILISALRYVTSGSDISTGSRTDTDVEDAKRTIANAVIGLVVIVLARTIILYVLNRV